MKRIAPKKSRGPVIGRIAGFAYASIYNSSTDAAKDLGTNSARIDRCCLGLDKSAGGHIRKYLFNK